MKQLNISEYIAAEKEKLKTLENVDKIKLGIIENDSTNAAYIESKLDDFKELGWKASVYKVREGESSCHDAIIRAIDHHCTSIIVQLPTRDGVDFDPFMIPRRLDCDGIRPDSFVNPSTPQGIIDYLKACEFPFSGKTAVVLSNSDMMCLPMTRLLLAEDMTVSICHNKSDANIVSGLLCDADLVVCATGRPHLVVRNQCTNAVVVDAGMNCQNGELVGDFEEKLIFCSDTVWSTPVPDGVNLLTRLALLKNCAKLVEGG